VTVMAASSPSLPDHISTNKPTQLWISERASLSVAQGNRWPCATVGADPGSGNAGKTMGRGYRARSQGPGSRPHHNRAARSGPGSYPAPGTSVAFMV
jgi:hypothetical protein